VEYALSLYPPVRRPPGMICPNDSSTGPIGNFSMRVLRTTLYLHLPHTHAAPAVTAEDLGVHELIPCTPARGARCHVKGPRPDGHLRKYSDALANASESSRILPNMVLQDLQSNPRTQFPHEVGLLQHEWSWSTARRRRAPVARWQMAHLPPWLSSMAAYSSAVIEYT
jgi:hypothetical protein